MKDELIAELLSLKLKNTQIEKDLGLPTNSLSAVLKGKKPMPDKWCAKIRQYIALKKPPKIVEEPNPAKDSMRSWVEEIETYCRSKGLYPDELIEFHKLHVNSDTSRALKMLRKGIETSVSSESRKVVNSGDKSREMYEPEEGTNAHFVRFGAFLKKDIQK